ncbi:MAG TPA: DUF5658 family protein [Pyrinomonadaceae bacterium]|jgi:hypothetical protein|nr:DUF5658 family protein [Pyrinomonadaceae bacterium]
MGALAKSLLLFALNWLDAQLTLFWVHSNVASEGNSLMNQLLKMGDTPFLLVKILIGAFAAYMLYRASHLPLARHGMRLVLTVYGLLMMAHVATGMFALGWPAPAVVTYISNAPYALMTLLG